MGKIISVHSFRGGTGKSNTTANLAALMAQSGQRVGVIDTDIQSPGIHILFGFQGDEMTASLNDFLWHSRELKDIAREVTDKLGISGRGKLYLVPSSTKPGEISRVLREGYDAQRLAQGFRQLMTQLELDALFIDTHPGLNEETLLSLVISSSLLVVLRPDQQDYEGTGITVRVARKLNVPKIMLLVNKTSPRLDMGAVKVKVEQAYGCPVAAVLEHSDEMMDLASGGVFSLRYPRHALTQKYRQVADML